MERKSTEVRITQNRKEETLTKKNEEISRLKAHINTQKLNCYILKITENFLNQKKLNVCEYTINHVIKNKV